MKYGTRSFSNHLKITETVCQQKNVDHKINNKVLARRTEHVSFTWGNRGPVNLYLSFGFMVTW